MPLGINSSIYEYKIACNARVQSINGIRSTNKSKIKKTHICPGQRAGQSHLRRYYSSPEAQCSICATSYKTETGRSTAVSNAPNVADSEFVFVSLRSISGLLPLKTASTLTYIDLFRIQCSDEDFS